jgi:hypothetical protein
MHVPLKVHYTLFELGSEFAIQEGLDLDAIET